MVKCKVEKKVKVILVMDPLEAETLKAYLQNPIERDEETLTALKEIFEALPWISDLK